MITWLYIPPQPDKMLPEQWHARAGCHIAGAPRSVAVLRDTLEGWQATVTGPNQELESMRPRGGSIYHAQLEIEARLKELGWT